MFTKVVDSRQIADLCEMAGRIWIEHYTPIIGKDQVNYMLEKFQSPDAVRAQIAAGYEYYLVEDGDEILGYFSYQVQGESLFLSKFYLRKEARGRGLGRKTIEFIADKAVACDADEIRLTVNKHNLPSIKVYEKLGFVNAGSTVADIGGGYVMDDYMMVKKLMPDNAHD